MAGQVARRIEAVAQRQAAGVGIPDRLRLVVAIEIAQQDSSIAVLPAGGRAERGVGDPGEWKINDSDPIDRKSMTLTPSIRHGRSGKSTLTPVLIGESETNYASLGFPLSSHNKTSSHYDIADSEPNSCFPMKC